jgi:large subunit ribosomal protein L31e
MQTDKVKIDQDLNRHIWSRGKTNPPRKIRLRMIKEDDDTVIVSSFTEEKMSEPESEESVAEESVAEESGVQEERDEEMQKSK